MAAKTYRFSHDLGRELAIQRLEPALDSLARQYGLERLPPHDGKLVLRRTGVDAHVFVADGDVEIVVDLNWFLEKTVRERIEDALHKDIPPLLRT